MNDKDYQTAMRILGKSGQIERYGPTKKEYLIEVLEVIALCGALYLAYWILP